MTTGEARARRSTRARVRRGERAGGGTSGFVIGKLTEYTIIAIFHMLIVMIEMVNEL